LGDRAGLGGPDTFKKSHHNTNMPLISRCAQAGHPGSAINSDDTSFELGRIDQLWGPNTMSFGGDIPDNTETLIVTYRYNCDRKYIECDTANSFT
jgi:hypothetical protein